MLLGSLMNFTRTSVSNVATDDRCHGSAMETGIPQSSGLKWHSFILQMSRVAGSHCGQLWKQFGSSSLPSWIHQWVSQDMFFYWQKCLEGKARGTRTLHTLASVTSINLPLVHPVRLVDGQETCPQCSMDTGGEGSKQWSSQAIIQTILFSLKSNLFTLMRVAEMTKADKTTYWQVSGHWQVVYLRGVPRESEWGQKAPLPRETMLEVAGPDRLRSSQDTEFLPELSRRGERLGVSPQLLSVAGWRSPPGCTHGFGLNWMWEHILGGETLSV